MSFTNCIIDLSHHNVPTSFHNAAAAGIKACIHKASQGTVNKDPVYRDRRARCGLVGIKWGAYHFGTGTDGVAQADHFLEAAAPVAGDILVLDIEQDNQGPSMTVAQAVAFVERIHAKTGKWPGIYYGHYLKEHLTTPNPTLAKCWGWISRYSEHEPIPQASWSGYTMWQYTDGAVGPGPHTVPGIGNCDRDKFHGTEAEFEAFWAAHSL
jgi:lysozyme